MTILALGGSDAEDKEQGYSAYLNALINSQAAIKKYPRLGEAHHLVDVDDVFREVVNFTGFKQKTSTRSSNYYKNAREKLAGEINGPGSALKFNFSNQRNFTVTDGQNLHTHLKTVFPNLKLNVRFTAGKPRCVVHVGL